jgi:ferrous-iron efflux pump FieF
LAPVDVQHGEIGIFVIVVSIVLTVGLVLVQRRVAKKTGSIAISADSMHYEGDLYMNVAVILAIALSFYGSISYADPVLGLVVSVLLLNNARHIAMQAGDQLMDRELLDDDREAIKEIIMSHPQVRGLHDLRTRISGTQKFIQCHVELDGDLSLFVAHEISDAIELRVMQSYPEADVIIHQDPAGQEKLTKLEKT